ncbi:hypothetical protein Tco_0608348 [Tanacetum coccineum]
MSKKSVLNDKGKGTGHREVRPIWNNTQRINHQNKFVPTAVLTRSGRIPVSTAKQYVNTATPKNRVNVSKSKINTFPKSHSPIRRPFYKSTVLNTRVLKEKVNTVRVNGVNTAGQTAVSTAKGNGVTAVKASARWESTTSFKVQGMFDSGCSRHMTGTKALLTDYKDSDGDFGFGGSTNGGKITDYPIWEVIQNGNGPVSITTDTQGQIKVLPPRTAEEILARERERKARTTLLMALPEVHSCKFHKMTDDKEMWDASI